MMTSICVPLSARHLQPFSASASSLGLSGTPTPLFNFSPVARFNLLLTGYCYDSLHPKPTPFARVSPFHYPHRMIPHALLLRYICCFNDIPNLSANPYSLVLTVHSIAIGFYGECHKHYSSGASTREALAVTPFVVEQLTPPKRQAYHGLISCEWGDGRATQSNDTSPSLPTLPYYSHSLDNSIGLAHQSRSSHPQHLPHEHDTEPDIGISLRRECQANRSGLRAAGHVSHYSFIQ